VGVCQRYLAQIVQGDSERIVGFRKEGRILEALGQSQGLLPILPRPLEVPTGIGHLPKSMQYRDELGWVPQPLAQRMRLNIDVFAVRGRPTLGTIHSRTEGEQQVQLVLRPLGGVRHGLQHLQSGSEMAHGFHIGRAFKGSLASPLPVDDRLRVEAGLSIVVRQQFGLGLGEVWKALDHYLRRALVVLLPCAPQQRLICRILE
jgi:hypothetical protein